MKAPTPPKMDTRDSWQTRLAILGTRLAIFWAQTRSNWRLFAKTKYGPIGLTVVLIYVIGAIMHPILMATVWDKDVYDPVTGLAETVSEEYGSPVAGTVVERSFELFVGASVVTEQELYKINTANGEEVTVKADSGYVIEDITANVGDVIGEGDSLLTVSPLYPLPPSAEHLLGTDPLGRDILSQLLFSTSSEILLGFIAAIMTLVVATLVGAAAAYFGGWLDAILMRIVDLVLMMPGLALLIVLGALFNLQIWSLAIVVGLLSGFGGAALIIKSQALTVKVKPFIDAARVSGSGHLRIIVQHIVPNVLPLAFLFMMFTVTNAVFSEAVLSFFGILNIRISWGLMLSVTQTQGYILDFARWWLVFPASLAITLFAGSFYLIGRGLDPVVNPRLRER